MKSLNKAQVIGNLGHDPDIRYMPSGDAVASLSVATNEKWKDKETGEQRERVEWHRVTAFGKLAEIAGEYLNKGDPVFIEGQLRTNKYTDKEGVERWSTEIVARNLIMLGSGDGGSKRPPHPAEREERKAPEETPDGTKPPPDDLDDDIPF